MQLRHCCFSRGESLSLLRGHNQGRVSVSSSLPLTSTASIAALDACLKHKPVVATAASLAGSAADEFNDPAIQLHALSIVLQRLVDAAEGPALRLQPHKGHPQSQSHTPPALASRPCAQRQQCPTSPLPLWMAPVHTVCVAVAADGLAFHYLGRPVTSSRLARVALFALVSYPLHKRWRALLDHWLGPENSLSLPSSAGKLRTWLDRGVFLPLMLCLFFTWMQLSEGNASDALPAIRAKLLPCMLANWSMNGLADAVRAGVEQAQALAAALGTATSAIGSAYSELLRPVIVRCGGEWLVTYVLAAVPAGEAAVATKMVAAVALADVRSALLRLWDGGAGWLLVA